VKAKGTGSSAVARTIWRFWLPAASIGAETCCHGGSKRRTITLTVRESGDVGSISAQGTGGPSKIAPSGGIK
jgi:hypothetical protein